MAIGIGERPLASERAELPRGFWKRTELEEALFRFELAEAGRTELWPIFLWSFWIGIAMGALSGLLGALQSPRAAGGVTAFVSISAVGGILIGVFLGGVIVGAVAMVRGIRLLLGRARLRRSVGA